MTQKPKVLLNRILAKPLGQEENRVGGIIVLSNAYGSSAYAAKVVAVGSTTLEVKVGDTILLGISAIQVKTGVPVQLEDGPHVVVKEDDVLVVL